MHRKRGAHEKKASLAFFSLAHSTLLTVCHGCVRVDYNAASARAETKQVCSLPDRAPISRGRERETERLAGWLAAAAVRLLLLYSQARELCEPGSRELCSTKSPRWGSLDKQNLCIVRAWWSCERDPFGAVFRWCTRLVTGSEGGRILHCYVMGLAFGFMLRVWILDSMICGWWESSVLYCMGSAWNFFEWYGHEDFSWL